MVILKCCLLFVFFIILDEGLLALLIELALLKLPGHNNIISHPEAARQDYSERSGTHLSTLRLGFHPSAFSESFKGLLLWGLACEFVMALEQYIKILQKIAVSWLENITNSVVMNLSKLGDSEGQRNCMLQFMGSQGVGHDLAKWKTTKAVS